MQKWIGEPYFIADLHLGSIADLYKFYLVWSILVRQKKNTGTLSTSDTIAAAHIIIPHTNLVLIAAAVSFYDRIP